MIMLLNFVL